MIITALRKAKFLLSTPQMLPHLFLLQHSLVLFLQFLHLKGQVVCPPRLLRHLLVKLLDLTDRIQNVQSSLLLPVQSEYFHLYSNPSTSTDKTICMVWLQTVISEDH